MYAISPDPLNTLGASPLASESKAEEPCTTVQVTVHHHHHHQCVCVLSSSSPVQGVLARCVKAELGGSQGPPGDAVAGVVQTAKRSLEPTAELVREVIIQRASWGAC